MDDDRYTRITLRIPKDLHQALQASADATSKSLNAEIINRLAASLEVGGGDDVAGQLKKLEKQVAQLVRLAEENAAGQEAEPARKVKSRGR